MTCGNVQVDALIGVSLRLLCLSFEAIVCIRGIVRYACPEVLPVEGSREGGSFWLVISGVDALVRDPSALSDFGANVGRMMFGLDTPTGTAIWGARGRLGYAMPAALPDVADIAGALG